MRGILARLVLSLEVAVMWKGSARICCSAKGLMKFEDGFFSNDSCPVEIFYNEASM